MFQNYLLKIAHSGIRITPRDIIYVNNLIKSSEDDKVTALYENRKLICKSFTNKPIYPKTIKQVEYVKMLDKDFIGKSDIIPVEEKKDGSYTAASQIMNRNELNTISNYVNHKIESIGKEMLQGNITINPYEMGQNSACTYCNYNRINNCSSFSHF